MLIKLGADVNARDLTQCTPLQNAAHGTYSALATMPLNGSQGGASGVLDMVIWVHSFDPFVQLLGVKAFLPHNNKYVFALICLSGRLLRPVSGWVCSNWSLCCLLPLSACCLYLWTLQKGTIHEHPPVLASLSSYSQL